ncbi:hypothetical protein EN802_32595 [bacterium M00.F.Ca.ET.159.01.1.1]|nr:hypothetical protein EN802_32595 [bacterium M00.F.Ca.ET.159.01.1.1]TGT79295.1 hypothetical protein EN800_31940 [bacterium M00.F.Ca.ET.157.01.1.1]
MSKTRPVCRSTSPCMAWCRPSPSAGALAATSASALAISPSSLRAAISVSKACCRAMRRS